MEKRRSQTERNESNRTLGRLSDLVPSLSELKRIMAKLAETVAAFDFTIKWSLWRRRHQAAAAISHYKSRANAQL
jgi:hypothetical protein